MTSLNRIHRCQFCGKTFERKSWFLRHSCPKKKKFLETNDVVVQHAYRVYVYWMRNMNMIRKNKEPDFEKFLKSPLKKAFVQIILYTQEQGIMSAYSYMDWIIKTRRAKDKWCSTRSEDIDAYKAYANIAEDPEDQALWTLTQIEKWIMEKPEDRSPDTFMDKLTPGVILSLVRERMIKPWPLLTYPPIADRWLSDDIYNPDVFYRIDDIINVDYWAEKIENNPDAVETVNRVMDQLWHNPIT